MVVGDNDINTLLIGQSDFIYVSDTTIDSNDKFGTASSALFYRFQIKTEAFIVPMRYIERNIFIFSPFEKVRQYYCPRDAIGVVVREDNNVFVIPNGFYQSIASPLHIW